MDYGVPPYISYGHLSKKFSGRLEEDFTKYPRYVVRLTKRN